MNIFVLSSGRCGSTGFARACSHMTNFRAGHESNRHKFGPARLTYPANFIESDNRLSWMLGRLYERYPDARYVHLTRDTAETAQSWNRRWHMVVGAVVAYRTGILTLPKEGTPLQICADYVETVNSNIREFLRDKPHVNVAVESFEIDFSKFWEWSGAKGNLVAALAEWPKRWNKSIDEQLSGA